jgi:hypothetical protein
LKKKTLVIAAAAALTFASAACAFESPEFVVDSERRNNTALLQAAGDDLYLTTVAAAPEKDTIVYENSLYGFSFILPYDWENYRIEDSEWEGTYINSADTGKIETGPVIVIRHPNWTLDAPMQDIPIMIFTTDQWDALRREELSVGAAPIAPSELGRNSSFVFALPARYNYEFLDGFKQVEEILESNPLNAFDPVYIGASLGGIRLGDSYEKVAGILGSDHTDTGETEFAGETDEAMTVWTYESGIAVTFSTSSGKAVRIAASASDYQTDLGIHAGSIADTVFEQYENAFITPRSRHSGKPLTGWYLTGTDEVLIFDFNKNNDIRTNFDLEPDSVVEEIVLGYRILFD